MMTDLKLQKSFQLFQKLALGVYHYIMHLLNDAKFLCLSFFLNKEFLKIHMIF